MVARKYGVVYTPDRLADFAAELLCSEIEESKFDNIKVLDPACGECALLDSVKKIKGKGYEYIGIDVDKTAILSASREYTIINNDRRYCFEEQRHSCRKSTEQCSTATTEEIRGVSV